MFLICWGFIALSIDILRKLFFVVVIVLLSKLLLSDWRSGKIPILFFGFLLSFINFSRIGTYLSKVFL